MRGAEAEVAGTDLDWTIVRPPALTNGPATGKYRTAAQRDVPRGFRLSRADLAACMLSLIGDAAAVRRHVAVAY
jgi:putative NADH-flavin reductase